MTVAIIITPTARKKFKSCGVTKDEEVDVLKYLKEYPDSGDVVPKMGGVRKVRMAAPSRNKGKRGGYRYHFFYIRNLGMPLHILDVYYKGYKNDLTNDEKKELTQLAAELEKSYKEKNL